MSKNCDRIKMFDNCFSLLSLSVLVCGARQWFDMSKDDKINGEDKKPSKRQKCRKRRDMCTEIARD